jgi:hypothetical protein
MEFWIWVPEKKNLNIGDVIDVDISDYGVWVSFDVPAITMMVGTFHQNGWWTKVRTAVEYCGEGINASLSRP